MSEKVKHPSAAILLVGGRGTRLAPLTDRTPKPMLPVGGVPFTLHQVLQARAAGVNRLVMATSYLAEVFEPYFGDGSRFGMEISYAVEEVALGTGGGIKNAAAHLEIDGDAPVVIFNGDVLSAHDLKAQMDFHRTRDADVTLYLTQVEDARAYGVVPTNSEGWVEAFLEKMENPITNQINAGCYIFKRSVIDEIESNRVVSVERETFPTLLQEGKRVQGFVDNGYWRDIGTPAALIAASADLVTGKFASAATKPSNSKSGLGFIDESAKVAENARIDAGSVVLAGAQVGQNCTILSSIVGVGAKIDDGVKIESAFVAPESRITLDNCRGEVLGF
ncbi:MAG: sugar phosphate nucleotidyltransferase [Candidatus Nanopelagicaceae bacterium]